MRKIINVESFEGLDELSKELADNIRKIRTNFFILLSGDLGSGKTYLTQKILKHLGHEGVVSSPTFTIVNEYSIDGIMIFHYDLYRIEDSNELTTLDILDRANYAVSIIEWPKKFLDRYKNEMPKNIKIIEVHIDTHPSSFDAV